jgi:hypothetical protein
MTLFEPGAHYVSYGATDQETLRELRDSYSGVLVPGTLAAFQQQGTGGFVLSLSGSLSSVPYSIDSRFPLFQQILEKPKKSHLALAEVFRDSALVVVDRQPEPGDFSAERLAALAGAWADFNLLYKSTASAKFDKYAKRLGEESISLEAASAPSLILAPYFIQLNEQWAQLSQRLSRETSSAIQGRSPMAPVVAVASAGRLWEAIDAEKGDRLAVWVSNLNELSCSMNELAEYYSAIGRATESEKSLFALYGGFSSVVALALGLRGISHGIGYGEYRNWRELPTSGPPPARYYAPALHRYLRQDIAQSVYDIDPPLAACNCAVCAGRPPLLLDYHELMKHSLLVRHDEILRFAPLSGLDALARLGAELDWVRSRVSRSAPAFRGYVAQPNTLWQHLATAHDALAAVLL